jgi:hypothetical protein
VHGLELGNTTGYGGRVAMIDNDDGSFNATVDQSWIRHKGPHTFSVWLQGRDISAGLHIGAANFVDSLVLRTVEFAPINCVAHMHADPKGGSCLCDSGFALEDGGESCYRLCEGATKVRCNPG